MLVVFILTFFAHLLWTHLVCEFRHATSHYRYILSQLNFIFSHNYFKVCLTLLIIPLSPLNLPAVSVPILQIFLMIAYFCYGLLLDVSFTHFSKYKQHIAIINKIRDPSGTVNRFSLSIWCILISFSPCANLLLLKMLLGN